MLKDPSGKTAGLVSAILLAVVIFAILSLSGSLHEVVAGTDNAVSTNNTPAATAGRTVPGKTASTAPRTGAKTYTLKEVSVHNGSASCWSAINGKVYDLTSFIDAHPGGAGTILSICGADGSAAFNDQHGGQRRPANELSGFYIGNLSS